MARDKLKNARKLRNLSQAALAKAVGLTVSEISRIECGYRDIAPDELQLLAKVLSVRPESISDNGLAPATAAQAAVSPAPVSAPVASTPENVVRSVAPAPAPMGLAAAKPKPVKPASHSDLNDPTNFTEMPDESILEPGGLDMPAYRSRMVQTLQRATQILHTSRVPAATWRAWREFERKIQDRLRRCDPEAPVRAPMAPFSPVARPAQPAAPAAPAAVSAPVRETSGGVAASPASARRGSHQKSYNAVFVDVARGMLPEAQVSQLNREAERAAVEDPSMGFMKHLRRLVEAGAPEAMLTLIRAEATRRLEQWDAPGLSGAATRSPGSMSSLGAGAGRR